MRYGRKSKNVEDRRAWDGANFGPYHRQNNTGRNRDGDIMAKMARGGEMTVEGIDRQSGGTEKDADRVTNKER
jgi:hypothetical protein